MDGKKLGNSSENALINQVPPINRLGLLLVVALARLKYFTKEYEEYYERNKLILDVTASVVIGYVIYLLALIAIYILDVSLLGATTEYWASLSTRNSIAIAVSKWGAPLCFLAAEVFIALKIKEARDNANEYETNAPYYGWLSLGFLVALVMPLVASYTALAVRTRTDDASPMLMVIILGIVSFACHILVLFGGDLAHAAKTYFWAKFRLGQKQAYVNGAAEKANCLKRKFQTRLIRYMHHWRKHCAAHGHVPAGPFDVDVTNLIKEYFPTVGHDSTKD